MKKRHTDPHALGILLLIMAVVYPFLPARATGASPDSLLRMPLPQRCERMTALILKAQKDGPGEAQALKSNLALFFEKHGNEKDRLIVELSTLLPVDNRLNFQDKNFEQKAIGLLSKAEELDVPYAKGKLNELLGLYYYNFKHDYFKAFLYYTRAYQLVVNLNEIDYPDRAYTIYRLARINYDFFDYENALRYGEVLTRLRPVEALTPPHIFNICLLGMACLKVNRPEKARYYFQWGLDRLPVTNLNNEAWIGILLGNVGLAYFEEKEYLSAGEYLKKGWKIAEQTKLWDNAPRFTAKLALIELVQRKNYSQALLLARKTLEMAKKNDSLVYPLAQFLVEPYEILSECHRALGNYEEAVSYADSAFTYSVQWKHRIDVAHKHKAEIAMELERHEARQALLEKEKERQILYRNGLLLLTLLGFIIAALLYNRQTLKDRHRKQQLLAEKQLAETELHNARAQLQQFRENARRKNQLITRLADDWQQAPADPTQDTARTDILHELQHSVLLTEDDWHAFTDLFEKVHPGFLYRLRVKLPDLSPAETRFVALHKLGYSPQEMAATLGVGLGAIRQYRLRIRRKFGVANDAEIDQLVAVI